MRLKFVTRYDLWHLLSSSRSVIGERCSQPGLLLVARKMSDGVRDRITLLDGDLIC